MLSLGLRKARIYIQKKRGTLFYAHPILRGPSKTFTIKKNDLAHAEYVYTPIHHGTHYQHTANSSTIDARRNTHPVGIRHILVMEGRKLQGFKLPKQALTNAFYLCLFCRYRTYRLCRYVPSHRGIVPTRVDIVPSNVGLYLPLT